MPEHEDTRPFLGWRVVGAAFTGQLIAAGVTFSAFGVFVVPLTEAFDTNVGRISLAFSVAFAVMMLVGPLVGHWLDRGLTRTLMLVGVSLSGLGLIGMSHATSLLQLGALYCGVVAIGAALFGLMPSMTLATNWFDRRRGLALGVTVAGATVATFIAPPAAAWLIERVGWRGALLWFGAAALVLGLPVFYRYTIARPEMVGQYPDGDPAPPAAEQGDGGEEPELETSALVRDRRLWFLSVGFALVFTSPIVMMLTLVPFAEGLGISRQEAAYFFSAAAPFSILSKVVFGAVSDRIPPRLAVWLVALINAAAWALLRLDPGYSFLLAIAVLYGIGIGAAGPLQGLLIARCFGPLAFGRAVGIGGLAALPLISGAPALAGFLFDTTGSYHLAFEIQAGAMLVGGALLSIPRIPQR